MKKECKFQKLADKIFVCVCAFLILIMGVLVYALPKESFSEEENRALSDFPRPSMSEFSDGSFFDRLSTFYSDRIPMRSLMIRVKAICELAGGKRQNNGVLFLDGGRLADRCEYDSTQMLEENLEALSVMKGKDTVYAIVPRSVDVYVGGEESKRITDTVLSYGLGDGALLDRLRQSVSVGNDVYYKTDHHLNAEGAYLLYGYITKALGVTPYGKDNFKIQTVSSDFLGSAYSAAGLLPTAYDEVTLYRYDGDTELSVSCHDIGCELDSVYCFEKLNIKDKYQIFLGGNHGVLDITHSDGVSRPHLLIIKDSFANAVIPLLAAHFDLTVVDPRYTDAAAEDSYDATVIIIGVDTLAEGVRLSR